MHGSTQRWQQFLSVCGDRKGCCAAFPALKPAVGPAVEVVGEKTSASAPVVESPLEAAPVEPAAASTTAAKVEVPAIADIFKKKNKKKKHCINLNAKFKTACGIIDTVPETTKPKSRVANVPMSDDKSSVSQFSSNPWKCTSLNTEPSKGVVFAAAFLLCGKCRAATPRRKTSWS